MKMHYTHPCMLHERATSHCCYSAEHPVAGYVCKTASKLQAAVADDMQAPLLPLPLLALSPHLHAACRLRHVQSVTLKRFGPGRQLHRDEQLFYELWRSLPDGSQQLLYVSEQVSLYSGGCFMLGRCLGSQSHNSSLQAVLIG